MGAVSKGIAAAVAVVLAIPAMLLPMMLGGAPNSGQAVGISGVPDEYVAYVLKAGQICPEVTPSIIAAQLDQESHFNPKAASPAGAQGIAQFMPGTWAGAGKDGDGDGKADILNPADAIWSQGNYMCAQVATVKALIAQGRVNGSPIELALAAYNAGVGNVLKYGGIPPFKETTAYVKSILTNQAKFVVTYSGGGAGAAASADQLAPGNTYKANFAAESPTMPDPTPGAHGLAKITPRLHRLIQDLRAAYPQIANLPALYCWDAHSFNPKSEHSRGRACDIPFYNCPLAGGNAARGADPKLGLKAGNAAANWLTSNAQKYGVYYVIWQGKIWYASSGWRTYGGTSGSNPNTCSGGHYDHIHVSVY